MKHGAFFGGFDLLMMMSSGGCRRRVPDERGEHHDNTRKKDAVAHICTPLNAQKNYASRVELVRAQHDSQACALKSQEPVKHGPAVMLYFCKVAAGMNCCQRSFSDKSGPS